MREWALGDDRASDAVRASDEHVFDFLAQAFRDLGFDAAESDARAKALYHAGVGYTHVGPVGRHDRGAGLLLAVLTAPSA